MKIRHENGQSILEQTLVLGAVIAVVVYVLLDPTSGIKTKVQKAYLNAGSAVDKTVTDTGGAGVFKQPKK